MNWKVLQTLAFTGLVFGLVGCDGNSTSSVNAAGKSETEKVAAAPTAESVIANSKERWDKIVRASEDESLWIELYDYETPEFKSAVSLSQFLSKKGDFHYDQPTEPKLLLLEDDTAYLDVSALWLSGRHPMVKTAQIGGDENMVQTLDMIEIWHWMDGSWKIQSPPKRKNEFFNENPDFLKRAQDAANGGAEEASK